jgi:hypothetical protein
MKVSMLCTGKEISPVKKKGKWWVVSMLNNAKSLPLPHGLLLKLAEFFLCGGEPESDAELPPSSCVSGDVVVQQLAPLFGASARGVSLKSLFEDLRAFSFFCAQQQVWAALLSSEHPSILQSPEHSPVTACATIFDCIARGANGLKTITR